MPPIQSCAFQQKVPRVGQAARRNEATVTKSERRDLGPMLGQTHHFVRCNKGKLDYAEKRYAAETQRLYSVLNTRLDGRDFIAGPCRGTYSSADMACLPWVSRFEWQEAD